jgi:hypothetical protein
MAWTTKLLRLNPWKRKRDQRLRQYLEAEEHEVMGIILRNRAEREEKERQIDLELFHEGREASNRLINREMRTLPLTLEYQRSLVAARIEIRKRLGLEYPKLLSDAQLSNLQETMLQSVQVARQARRGDYERAAAAAGVPVVRPAQSDAAEYGDLEALIRREIRLLSLGGSLGRLSGKKQSGIRAMFKLGSEWEPLIKLLAAVLALAAAAIGLYRLFHKG